VSEEAKTFHDLESSINDLDRWGDIALTVCRDELHEKIKVVENGNATACVIKHLVSLIKELRKEYFEAYESA
jgi:hypothetical protein